MLNLKTEIGRVRALLIFFMLALALSGITAIPLQWELSILDHLFGSASTLGQWLPTLGYWISLVYDGLRDVYTRHPFLAYGTDWLAFAHVVIAIAFIGPLRNPVKNIWVVEFGMIACLLILPWVLIFGPLRGIPLFWRLIDMSFGVFGIIPLWLIRREILKMPILEG